MDIKKAREQIVDTVRAYLAKDELGRPLIPYSKQRPLFIAGPPGIGKTEIMAQAAEELGIGLLSYSMTHHTRQSAIGLPIIKQGEYRGETFDVTEYTMSEILSSVYSQMKETGIEEGILFLDEINCISETLTPVMLQFLQYKVFGGHRLPEGWVVVTAGNPPEFNSSVREFDVATCDRLKMIEVSPDVTVWREYAQSRGVHSAVLTYLEIKPGYFYKIERTAGRSSYVTARGWDDLSRMLLAYERLDIPVDKELIRQYLRIDQIADDFALYYELYNKYRSDYRISRILAGEEEADVRERAGKASFDERYSLLGLILETVTAHTAELLEEDELLIELRERLKNAGDDPAGALEQAARDLRQERDRLRKAGGLSESREKALLMRAAALDELRPAALEGLEAVKEEYSLRVGRFTEKVSRVKSEYSNMFRFCEEAFGQGQELLILVTELTASPLCARYIASYGCEEYHKYDKALMFHERRTDIITEIDRLSDEN